MSLVEKKLEGISGSDKICTLQPFKVLEIIGGDKEKPEEPKKPEGGGGAPEAPKDKSPIALINWLISILEWIKQYFKT